MYIKRAHRPKNITCVIKLIFVDLKLIVFGSIFRKHNRLPNYIIQRLLGFKTYIVCVFVNKRKWYVEKTNYRTQEMRVYLEVKETHWIRMYFITPLKSKLSPSLTHREFQNFTIFLNTNLRQNKEMV